MKKDLKICLPLYKIIYSLVFVIGLSMVRGVSGVNEIGSAMEAAIAVLVIIFCSDTYLTEVQNHREAVFHIYSTKKKTAAILRRLSVQILYLTGVSVLGYGFFLFFQKPQLLQGESSAAIFAMFLAAIVGTIIFWSLVSMTICNLWRNIWAGIGSSLLLWLAFNSQLGDSLFGKWNLFSYTFYAKDAADHLDWLCGKTVGIGIALVLIGCIPSILKKRG